MTREEIYREQMQDLGIYLPVFEPDIKTLATMERELQRMRKRWRAEGSDMASVLYERLAQGQREIVSLRAELGLTPKALHERKPEFFGGEYQTVLARMRAKYGKQETKKCN